MKSEQAVLPNPCLEEEEEEKKKKIKFHLTRWEMLEAMEETHENNHFLYFTIFFSDLPPFITTFQAPIFKLPKTHFFF
jgi:hypothetical protein